MMYIADEMHVRFKHCETHHSWTYTATHTHTQYLINKSTCIRENNILKQEWKWILRENFCIKIPTTPQQKKNKLLTTIFFNYVSVHNSSHTISTTAAFQTDETWGDISKLHHAVLSTTNIETADHLIFRLITLLNYITVPSLQIHLCYTSFYKWKPNLASYLH